ncbi:unnamed protein product [Litomosoides sigmodontis]|uniref:G-protein coupled receptors family 1 profile domain-containing protein n=1 Tax=Litomosoides sigmodontis TaxID=42156 RepID=A0A3P6T448_LITSI|nr:unnamed protein product [Litomosoides sigmodontis]
MLTGERLYGCKRVDCGVPNDDAVHGRLPSVSSSFSQDAESVPILPPGITSCRFVVCDRKIETWYKVYEWCRETISRLLPFVLVAYFNSKILITYRNTKKERFQRLASNQQNISMKSEQEEKQLFTLLFSIVIIFFICTIPAAPLTIFVSDKRSFNVPFQIIRAIINVMEFTKFALNFYFYCLINPNIRLICLNMFRSKQLKKPFRKLGQTTNSVSHYARNSCFSAYDCKPSNGSSTFLRSLPSTKPENVPMDESDKQLTTIDDNLPDEKGVDEDDAGDGGHGNSASATTDDSAIGD